MSTTTESNTQTRNSILAYVGQQKTILEAAALKAVEAGFSIIPVGKDKKPTIPEWTTYQKRHATAEEVNRWFGPYSNATGLAVICGKISGGLLVIDFDQDTDGLAKSPLNLEDDFVKVWADTVGQFVDFESIPKQRTGSGGYQFFVRGNNPGQNTKLANVPANNAKGFHTAIETRAEGGYAVIAPSVSGSGPYTWLNLNLSAAPFLTNDEAATLLQIARELDRMSLKDAERQKATERVKKQKDPVIKAWNEKYHPGIILERNGYERFGTKYLSPDSLSGNPGVTVFDDAPLIYSHHGDALGDGKAHDAFDCFKILEHGGDFKTAYKAASNDTGVKNDKQDDNLSESDCRDMVIEWFTEEGRFFRVTEPAEKFYEYRDGFYNEITPTAFKRVIEATLEELGTRPTERLLSAVVQKVARVLSVADVQPTGLYNLANGVFNLKTQELTQHSPELFFTAKSTVAYDSIATCEKFLGLLAYALPDVEKQMMVQEQLGIMLDTAIRDKRTPYLYGESNTGKSTIVRAISKVLGADAVNGLSFDDMNGGFKLVQALHAKMIWINEPSRRNNLEGYKRVSGGDPVQVEAKFENAYSVTLPGKIVVTANEQVFAGDDRNNASLINRFVFYRFDNVIQNVDGNFDDKLEGELSGIFNWLLEGLNRYQSKNSYMAQWRPGGDDTREFKRASSNVYCFVEDCLEADPQGKIAPNMLYHEYAEYCRQDNTPQHRVLARNAFKQPFLKNAKDILGVNADNTKKSDGICHYLGVRLRREDKAQVKGDDYIDAPIEWN